MKTITPIAAHQAKSFSLPRLHLDDGALELLKWLALVFMAGDHINKYLFNETLPYLFELGRLAAPLFALVLAYNLARPDAMKHRVYARVMKRLAIVGVLATPAFLALGGLLGGWYPLNIMFMLFTATAAMYFIERERRSSAFFVVLVGGAFVEFWWPAVGFTLAVWSYVKAPNLRALLLGTLCCAALWIINRNLWALAALPVGVAAGMVTLSVPRARWAFYAFYPAHLSVLWAVRFPMAKAGYLFFT